MLSQAMECLCGRGRLRSGLTHFEMASYYLFSRQAEQDVPEAAVERHLFHTRFLEINLSGRHGGDSRRASQRTEPSSSCHLLLSRVGQCTYFTGQICSNRVEFNWNLDRGRWYQWLRRRRERRSDWERKLGRTCREQKG